MLPRFEAEACSVSDKDLYSDVTAKKKTNIVGTKLPRLSTSPELLFVATRMPQEGTEDWTALLLVPTTAGI